MKLREAVAWDRVPPQVRPKRYTNGISEMRGLILAIPELSRFDLVETGGNHGRSRRVPEQFGASPGLSRGKGAGKFRAYNTRTRNDFERCGFRTMLGRVRDHPGPPRVGSAIFVVQFTNGFVINPEQFRDDRETI